MNSVDITILLQVFSECISDGYILRSGRDGPHVMHMVRSGRHY